MNKYFIRMMDGTGFRGYEVIEAESLEKANKEARYLCIDWMESFGYEQDEDYFGDLDQLGCDWDGEEYNNETYLEYSAEPYNPEEHDGDLY